MTKDMVNWGDTSYRDTGEGGLFAYVVWRQDITECCVTSGITLTLEDVLVHAEGPLADEVRESEKLSRRIDCDFYPTTAVLIGATSASLYSDYDSKYFSVTKEALTKSGRKLVKGLSELHGSEPTFITFLDT